MIRSRSINISNMNSLTRILKATLSTQIQTAVFGSVAEHVAARFPALGRFTHPTIRGSNGGPIETIGINQIIDLATGMEGKFLSSNQSEGFVEAPSVGIKQAYQIF